MNKYILIISVFSVIGILGLFGFVRTDTNSITGKPIDTRVNIMPATPTPCDFTLPQGWSMVSFFCLGNWVSKDDALESINGSYGKIFYYSATDDTDPWKSYNPDLPTWAVQQIDYMDRVTGYFIYMKSEDSFFYNGSKKYTVINLYPGWNLVGYPNSQSEYINVSLDGLLYSTVKKYNSSANEFLVYNTAGVSNLFTFDEYYGYWINSSASQTWIIS